MQLQVNIKYTLNQILDLTFHEKANQYKRFYIQAVYGEKKSNYTKIDYPEKLISVTSFSRSKEAILLSYLVGLAQFVDITNRKETHYDEEYYKVLYQLIYTAVKYKFIDLKDIYKLEKKYLDKLQVLKGSINKWKINFEENYVQDKIIIYVFDAYFIKNILSANGYHFDEYQNAWYKLVENKEEMEEEKILIENYQYEADFQIISKPFFIKPYYTLQLMTYSYENAPLLRSLSYQYDKVKNTWSKEILASDWNDEVISVESIPKQYLKIVPPKRN